MTAQTLTLTDFLYARIAEDERHARKLAETDNRPVLALALTVNHPERILLECDAKRRIVELAVTSLVYGDESPAKDDILAILALPYADHPEYPEEWKP